MAFCPNCRTEYREGFTRCADCDVELVESLPAEEPAQQPADNREELVEVATFPNASEAEMIQELLEDNGIGTVLRGDVDPIGTVSGAAPSTLLVRQADFENARKIYEDFFDGEPVDDASAEAADEEDLDSPDADEPK